MKLIVALGLKEYQDELINIFNQEHVPIFSEVDIQEFHRSEQNADLMNWFGGESNPDFSVLFFSFTGEESSKNILEQIKNLNGKQANGRPPFHAFIMDVEQYI